MYQRLGKYSCCRSTVTGYIICFLGNFLDQLSTNTCIRILKVDFLCNGNAIIGDRRSTIGFVKDNIAAFGPKGYLNGVCELIKAFKHALARLFIILNNLCHTILFL